MKKEQKIKKGKFIAIDGIDGAGKFTQVNLLVKRLQTQGHKTAIIDFPQYEKKSAGLVCEYLNGKYGQSDKNNPYIASLFYACDRYDGSFKIKEWLSKGTTVIANRYVSANMGHQGGKLKTKSARLKYFKWLYDLEYNIFKIPKPNLNIILDINVQKSQKLVEKKDKRDYINNNAIKDIHELDLKHLENARKVYLEIAKNFSDFILVDCIKDKELMTRQEINDLIWEKIKKYVKKI